MSTQLKIDVSDIDTKAGRKIDKMIHESWRQPLKHHIHSAYLQGVAEYIAERRRTSVVEGGETKIQVYPETSKMFRALSMDLSDVKVLILGADPYHSPGQADGLAFSCGKTLSPSLLHVFKAIWTDVRHSNPDELECYLKYWKRGTIPQSNPDKLTVREVMPMKLDRWYDQGVMLLNRFLSVEQSIPNSHAHIGWHQFTGAIVEVVAQQSKGCVFMLWGQAAKSVTTRIKNSRRHEVLTCEHPVAASYRNDNWNSQDCFNKANLWLNKKYGEKAEIVW